MRYCLYNVAFVMCMWPIMAAWLFDDPCEISPPSMSDENKTTVIYANNSCINGIIRWDYARGNVLIHFISRDFSVFSACFSNWLIGNALTFFDVYNGIEHKLEPIKDQGYSCTLPHKKEVIVRIQAPETLLYVAGVRYEKIRI
ncbi:hypothetical protein ACJMK2_005437 [Sinanodonta woodiana]|uniref:Uncharacterized protein n=1 Tax=Sinanodonta woodiana TaxID=1069815 RepID=A0ABD3VQ22_SINWO